MISMVLCFALGIANIFHFNRPLLIIFSALCLYVSSRNPKLSRDSRH